MNDQPLLPIFDVIRDTYEDLITERDAYREAKESLEMDLEHAEREVELLKAKVEELSLSVYGEAA